MEAAGFAVGVVALASLFSTCVELLDYIELGKNYLQDYKLACNKINILHTRLTIWGVTARILLPGDEHPLLRIPAKRDAVSEGLQSLKDVLQDTELLRRKYDLSTHKPACQSNAKDPAGSPKIANWSHLLRKRTTWSIRDKAKFDKFIADISFLMGNLEKVTETLDSSDDGKNTSLQQHQPGAKTRQGNAAATSTESISDQPAPAAAAAGGAFLLEFTGNLQTNTDQSSGLMGAVGLPPGPMRFADNEQQNSNKSHGVVGAMTEAAYASGRKGKFDLAGTADKNGGGE